MNVEDLTPAELKTIVGHFMGQDFSFQPGPDYICLECFSSRIIRKAMERFGSGIYIGRMNGRYMARFDGGGCQFSESLPHVVCLALADLIHRKEQGQCARQQENL